MRPQIREFLSKLANIHVADVMGIPVILNWTWWLMLFLMFGRSVEYGCIWLATFFIVFLHEIGHCYAALRYGLAVRSIVLYPIGGAATLAVPEDSRKELVIAAAGPLVNVAFILPLCLGGMYSSFLHTVAICNCVLLLFNMVPAFPMDGGRLFRAGLDLIIHDRLKATQIAFYLCIPCCLIFVVLGIYLVSPMLSIIGGVVAMLSYSEYQMLKLQRTEILSPEPNSPRFQAEIQDLQADVDRSLRRSDRI